MIILMCSSSFLVIQGFQAGWNTNCTKGVLNVFFFISGEPSTTKSKSFAQNLDQQLQQWVVTSLNKWFNFRSPENFPTVKGFNNLVTTMNTANLEQPKNLWNPSSLVKAKLWHFHGHLCLFCLFELREWMPSSVQFRCLRLCDGASTC